MIRRRYEESLKSDLLSTRSIKRRVAVSVAENYLRRTMSLCGLRYMQDCVSGRV
jgi:hypothetical protein